MKAKAAALLVANLGVTKSHSRSVLGTISERLAEPVAVAASVGDERFGLRQGAEDQPRSSSPIGWAFQCAYPSP